MMRELQNKLNNRKIDTMDPEERKKMEEAKKPTQTGDVKAKMALLAGGGDNSDAGTTEAPKNAIIVNKNAPPPPPPPPPPKAAVLMAYI